MRAFHLTLLCIFLLSATGCLPRAGTAGRMASRSAMRQIHTENIRKMQQQPRSRPGADLANRPRTRVQTRFEAMDPCRSSSNGW